MWVGGSLKKFATFSLLVLFDLVLIDLLVVLRSFIESDLNTGRELILLSQ